MSKKQDLAACLLGIVVAIILWFTILGRDIQADVVFLRPFHSFQALWRDVQYGRVTGNLFGNILIFIPVGFLISTVTESVPTVVEIGEEVARPRSI
jgi:glycopeptide antibiotics resistance protein